MKKTFTLLFSMAVLSQSNMVFAQEQRCGTAERLRELYARDPQLRADHEEFLRNCFAGTRSGDTTLYKIPVVFHIIHEYGSENISDAQVRRVIDILNEDFRKLNSDQSEVTPEFASIMADAHIEFGLATLDPDGNCTNGINHYYSHETRVGDDYSKLVQWPRSKYLNVWVTRDMDPRFAAYAYHPTDVAALPYAINDGVIIRYNYVGDIGTSGAYARHTLTHEIGHYFSLNHTWGGTNDAGVTCGDDGIADTPVTKGHLGGCPVSDQTCTPGITENVQNYMEYSDCIRMFTNDQVEAIRDAAASNISNRNNLWSAANLDATGVNVMPAPVCTPVADMHTQSNIKYICPGDNVTFMDASWRATVDSWSWSFPGGVPSTSTAANPVVNYATPGWHDVTLTVSNAAGTSMRTFNQAIYVSNPWTEYVGPHAESFEAAGPSDWWIVENPENNEAGWHRVNTAAASGSYSFMLNNHKDVDVFSANYFNRLGANRDALISPSYDLSHTSSATLSFKYSCATHAATLDEQKETFKIYVSVNCGRSWVLRDSIKRVDLANGGTVTGNYVPGSGMWVTKTINIPLSFLQPNVRFKFEYTASDFSNNMYLDDININGILGETELSAPVSDLSVYPNPSGTGQGINVSFTGNNEPVQLLVTDLVGKTVYSTGLVPVNGRTVHRIAENVLSSGMYQVTITNGVSRQSVKLVVQQ